MEFFSKMQALNKAAIGLFVVAKILGLSGVCMGFLGKDYHMIGGYFLSFAMISIFSSVTCSLIQTKKDKKIFSKEDEENKKIKSLEKMKVELKEEIKFLEEKRNSLTNLMIKKEKRYD